MTATVGTIYEGEGAVEERTDSSVNDEGSSVGVSCTSLISGV